MGFNKRYLPELEDLKKIREKMGDDENFLKTYLYRPDAIFGSSGSFEYVKEVENSYNEKQEENNRRTPL
jgi:hypothetical protein